MTHVSSNDALFPIIQATKGKFAASAMKGKYGEDFPDSLVKRARATLMAMDAAVVVQELRFPPGNQLEELNGNRTGKHSVQINGQWRTCGVWAPNGLANVEIVDCQ